MSHTDRSTVTIFLFIGSTFVQQNLEVQIYREDEVCDNWTKVKYNPSRILVGVILRRAPRRSLSIDWLRFEAFCVIEKLRLRKLDRVGQNGGWTIGLDNGMNKGMNRDGAK